MPSRRQCGYDEALEAARYLRRRVPDFPQVGIVLGSGLEGVAEALDEALAIPYPRIPHFPRPGVAGHPGTFCAGRWGNLPVAILQGRVHLYEGYTPAEVVFPVRALGLAGVRILIFTCSAGGIAPRATVGSLMVFSDHLNLQGSSPLAGPVDQRWGERFLDMSAAYDLPLRRMARKAAKQRRLKCFDGVYAAVFGPNYETPAEVCALRRLGADAIGMSTVPEVIAAWQMGLRVLAIAAISNRAAGLSKRPLAHAEVLETGREVCKAVGGLLDGVLRELEKTAAGRKASGGR